VGTYCIVLGNLTLTALEKQGAVCAKALKIRGLRLGREKLKGSVFHLSKFAPNGKEKKNMREKENPIDRSKTIILKNGGGLK